MTSKEKDKYCKAINEEKGSLKKKLKLKKEENGGSRRKYERRKIRNKKSMKPFGRIPWKATTSVKGKN
jgi:hypothetical protein